MLVTRDQQIIRPSGSRAGLSYKEQHCVVVCGCVSVVGEATPKLRNLFEPSSFEREEKQAKKKQKNKNKTLKETAKRGAPVLKS